mmetsp:Transcript_3322/g.7218  ORF Transcript_3322/g.7218 Transcript_3322/m.7218 type:complete len:122 (-) Transcript_3322:372-737(-)
MLELSEETDLAKGGGRDALVFDLQADPLEGNNLVVRAIPRLVNDAIRSLAEVRAWLFNLLVPVEYHQSRCLVVEMKGEGYSQVKKLVAIPGTIILPVEDRYRRSQELRDFRLNPTLHFIGP